ncbi:MAG TPA: universal stress protein [Nitrospirota bacterium]|nr:universal stress protein [Nitrospirota bacterium]
MKKMLIAINDSASAMKAVEYAAEQFAADSIQIGLVHVLPNLPAIFWDEGHILSDDEKRDRKKVVDKWLDVQRGKIEPLLKKAVEVLNSRGIPSSRILTKFVSDSTDVADSIIEEARDGGYETIVVGRFQHSPKNALGTVSQRIATLASGLTVTIVG